MAHRPSYPDPAPSLLEDALSTAFEALAEVEDLDEEVHRLVTDALELRGLQVGGDVERAREASDRHRLVDPDADYRFIPPTGIDPASLVGSLVGNGLVLALIKTEGGRKLLHGLNHAKYVRFTVQRALRRLEKHTAPYFATRSGRVMAQLLDGSDRATYRAGAPDRVLHAVDAAKALCGGCPDGTQLHHSAEWNHLARGLAEALRQTVDDPSADASTLAIAPQYLRDLNAVRASYGKVPFDFPEGTLSIDNEFAGEPVCFTLRPDGEFDVDAPAPRIDPGMTSLDDLDVDDADGLDAAGSDDLRAPRPASPLPIRGRRSGRRSLPGTVGDAHHATDALRPGDGATPTDPHAMGDVRSAAARPDRARHAARRPGFNGRNGPTGLS